MSGFSRAGSVVLRGYLSGLQLANGADANNDIDIASGVATDSGAARLITLAAALTKQLDAAWAVGTNQGGLDTGAKAASTWYHVFLISNGAVVDVLFSTSATAPTMPAGYTFKRRIGAVLTDGISNIRGFKQSNDYFQWKTPAMDASNTSQSSTRVSYAVSSPLGVRCLALLRLRITSASTVLYLTATSPEVDDAAPHYQDAPLFDTVTPVATGINSPGQMQAWTDESSQIAVRADGACNVFRLLCIAYTDRRGKD